MTQIDVVVWILFAALMLVWWLRGYTKLVVGALILSAAFAASLVLSGVELSSALTAGPLIVATPFLVFWFITWAPFRGMSLGMRAKPGSWWFDNLYSQKKQQIVLEKQGGWIRRAFRDPRSRYDRTSFASPITSSPGRPRPAAFGSCPSCARSINLASGANCPYCGAPTA